MTNKRNGVLNGLMCGDFKPLMKAIISDEYEVDIHLGFHHSDSRYNALTSTESSQYIIDTFKEWKALGLDTGFWHGMSFQDIRDYAEDEEDHSLNFGAGDILDAYDDDENVFENHYRIASAISSALIEANEAQRVYLMMAYGLCLRQENQEEAA